MTERADGETRVYVVTDRWPPRRTSRQPSAWIFCPCVRGLGPGRSLLLSALPIHDANAELLAAVRKPSFEKAGRRPDFAGLFLLDPFRRIDLVVEEIRAAGVRGIVNLPTVEAFDGELRTALQHVGLGIEKEMEALTAARRRGLRTLRMARAPKGGWCLIEGEKAGAAAILTHSEWIRKARTG